MNQMLELPDKEFKIAITKNFQQAITNSLEINENIEDSHKRNMRYENNEMEIF